MPIYSPPIATEASLEALKDALQWLDRLLAAAVQKAPMLYGAEAIQDIHRGLYVDDRDVEQLLGREPGHPLFSIHEPFHWQQHPRFSWLKQSMALSEFDLAVVIIAIAPELDLRYERLYAYLQDDVTRKHPTVDLVLNLLCVSSPEKLQKRQHFTSDAPLIRQRMIHLIPEANQTAPPLLSHSLKLDEQIIQFLLAQPELDRRLVPFCQLIQPAIAWEDMPVAPEIRLSLRQLTQRASDQQTALKLYLQGVPGVGKRSIAEAIATQMNASLLTVNLSHAAMLKLEMQVLLSVAVREAQLKQAVLYLPGIAPRVKDDQDVWQQLWLEELLSFGGVTVLAGTQPWSATTPSRSSVISIPLEIPDYEQRRSCWQQAISAANGSLNAIELDALANQFRLTPEQILNAVNQVTTRRNFSQLGDEQPRCSDYFAAARNQSGEELQALAQKIEPRYGWNDIILPPDPSEQLQEICDQVRYRQTVYQIWGFGQKLALGKGVTALFSGPPGTGKTMAAEIIAQDLQLDLYKIDLSQVVSKYIGETEKNLDRIFTAAETANAILFFDEADALFGKRAEVKDAHDRYANIEVGYLLQKVESYSGLAILATNLRQNLDEAFIRRMQAIVEFPFPDEEFRYRIWQVTFPDKLPLHETVDLAILAREVKLPGGNIKNIGLAAAFYAAKDGGVLMMEHLLKAAQREYQKLGKSWRFQLD